MFYGFVVLVFSSLFMLPGLNNLHIIPAGLNSIGYLIDGASPYYISATLSLFLIIEIITIYYLITKLDFQTVT